MTDEYDVDEPDYVTIYETPRPPMWSTFQVIRDEWYTDDAGQLTRVIKELKLLYVPPDNETPT
ncbi:MAG: hypothetical protein LC749_02300 [Actinobacteria bacterium]|nr:hypothetical protein [Actinomycetota bacterium]